jgi:hypothetical protein
MRRSLALLAVGTLMACASDVFSANLLLNGNLDKCDPTEIVPGFFLPKPRNWANVGTRAISGPYEDEMSSEPWAGPAPTPVTNGGDADPPAGVGIGNDGAVFFKAFSGNASDGAATGHLYQNVPGTVGTTYQMTGWAGAEANLLVQDAQFAIEFLNGGGGVIGGTTLSLLPNLFVPNGQPFNYKQYTLSSVAPVGTVSVRARASFINGLSNPAGGGQAFVIDDFTLDAVPEPGCAMLGLVGALGTLRRVRRR